MRNVPKALPPLSDTDVARFWSHVRISGPDDCWEWQAQRLKAGYGQFKAVRRTLKAHRVAYLLQHGIDPGIYLVCHSCDNPCCCNGGHLFLGDSLANTTDAKGKGRLRAGRGERHGSRTHPESRTRGERSGNAKVTADDVRAMRSLYADGLTQQQLSKRFGISRESVGLIIRGINWAHIAAEDGYGSMSGANRYGKQGESNHSAKLTEDDVRHIRQKHETGASALDLALEFGVTNATIYHIVRRKTWSHIN